jgi:uncharacterized membrane protein
VGGMIMDEGLVLGVVILIVGIILLLFPPKEINNIYGYRTSSSMRNKEIGIEQINIVVVY